MMLYSVPPEKLAEYRILYPKVKKILSNTVGNLEVNNFESSANPIIKMEISKWESKINLELTNSILRNHPDYNDLIFLQSEYLFLEPVFLFDRLLNQNKLNKIFQMKSYCIDLSYSELFIKKKKVFYKEIIKNSSGINSVEFYRSLEDPSLFVDIIYWSELDLLINEDRFRNQKSFYEGFLSFITSIKISPEYELFKSME